MYAIDVIAHLQVARPKKGSFGLDSVLDLEK